MTEEPARTEPATSPATAQPRPKRNRVLEQAYKLDNELTLTVRMVGLLARIFARLCATIEVQGLENIPRKGPVIITANHISNLDPIVAGAWITTALRGRRIHWLGKRELFDWPVIGWASAHGGVHPVNRGAADVESFRLATRILESGYVLFVFPEGTRSPTGELQEAKDGTALLAIRTRARIVPVGINNADAVWKKGKTLPSPFPRRRITVRIGESYAIEDAVPPGTDRRATKGLLTTAIMDRIAALLEPRHRGFYADSASPDSAREQAAETAPEPTPKPTLEP